MLTAIFTREWPKSYSYSAGTYGARFQLLFRKKLQILCVILFYHIDTRTRKSTPDCSYVINAPGKWLVIDSKKFNDQVSIGCVGLIRVIYHYTTSVTT